MTLGRPAALTPLVARAARRLARWPEVRFTTTATTLHVPVPNPDGFSIRLRARGRRQYVVRFDGWVHVFDRDDDALDCFELGLSDSCRLAVTFRGATAVAWTVETTQYGMWSPHHRTSRRLVPFWRAPRTEYRQNRVILSRPWTRRSETNEE